MGTCVIRFNEEKEGTIQDFLEKVFSFDFSTLARTVMLAFIKNQRIDLKPVKIKPNKQKTYRRIW